MAMKLSDTTGQYQQTGGLLESYFYVASGGETEFSLTFTEGNEEVYLNGARLVRGPTQDYTTLNGKIILNQPLISSDIIQLVGRSADTSIAQTRAQSESVILNSGQLSVTFSTISTEPLVLHISGTNVDDSQLVAGKDYTVIDDSTIQLTTSYPQGTSLTGTQGNRTAWVDPTSMVVNDGTKAKDLGSRFRDTMESRDYFVWSTGRQLSTLENNTIIARYIPGPDGMEVVLDSAKDGYYQVLEYNGILYEPMIDDYRSFRVISFTVPAGTNDLVVNASEVSTGEFSQLHYTKRISRVAPGTETNPLTLGSGDIKATLHVDTSGNVVLTRPNGSNIIL